MALGLGLGLTQKSFKSSTGADADAAAYIAAVKAAGATVSASQETAINTFFVDTKADGSYSSLECMYFPIWGVAAANAICLITLASGTFNGSVTHASGYIQGDGTTGYLTSTFNPNASSADSHSLWAGHLQSSAKVTNNQTFWGTSGYLMRRFAAGDTITVAPGSTDWASQNGTGIMSAYWNSGNTFIYQRLTSGRNLRASTTGLTQTSIGSLVSYVLARNTGTVSDYSNIRLGAWWIGIKPSSDSVESLFTLNLKTLWETCTGLTLP